MDETSVSETALLHYAWPGTMPVSAESLNVLKLDNISVFLFTNVATKH